MTATLRYDSPGRDDVAAARPASLRRCPGDPVVEGAGAEHDRDGDGVDRGREPCSAVGGLGDQQAAEGERDDERVEVEDAAEHHRLAGIEPAPGRRL